MSVVVKRALSRERILIAAVDLIDREGLAALTMRRLGQQLGVEAMSLYRHVNGRGALLDGIHETILRELEEPARRPSNRSWSAAVRQYARSFRHVLIRHPNAIELFATRPAVTPSSLRHIDRGLAILREGAGLTIEESVSAFQILVTFVVGHVLSTHGVIPKEEETTPSYDDAVDMKFLVEAAEVLATRDLDAEFEIGLDVLIEGLKVRLRIDR